MEAELAGGARYRPLARKFGVSYDCLWRHYRRHLTQAEKDRLKFGDAPAHKLKGMVAEAEISVLRDLNFARQTIIEALEAVPAEDGHARATLTGRLHENARIRGQLSGDLSRSPLIQNNSTTYITMRDSPEIEQLKRDLVDVLQNHPAALADVIAVFERAEAAPLPALEHQPREEEHDGEKATAKTIE
jgi:hypothetical protein